MGQLTRSHDIVLCPNYDKLYLNLNSCRDRYNDDINPYLHSDSNCDLGSDDSPYLDVSECQSFSLNSFSTLFCNIRSLSKHLDEFVCDHVSSARSYDVIGMTETHMARGSECLFRNSIPNYNFAGLARDSHGGGVAFFIDKKYTFELMEDLSCTLSHVESLFNKLNLGHQTLVMGCIYRPSGGSSLLFLEYIDSILELLSHDGWLGGLVIGGDFNIDLLEYNRNTSNLLSTMTSFGMRPVIRGPTRVTSSTVTLLD